MKACQLYQSSSMQLATRLGMCLSLNLSNTLSVKQVSNARLLCWAVGGGKAAGAAVLIDSRPPHERQNRSLRVPLLQLRRGAQPHHHRVEPLAAAVAVGGRLERLAAANGRQRLHLGFRVKGLNHNCSVEHVTIYRPVTQVMGFSLSTTETVKKLNRVVQLMAAALHGINGIQTAQLWHAGPNSCHSRQRLFVAPTATPLKVAQEMLSWNCYKQKCKEQLPC